MSKDLEIGKAFRAFEAFNYMAKKDRLRTFDMDRWLKVVRALNGGGITRRRVKRKKGPGRPRKAVKP